MVRVMQYSNPIYRCHHRWSAPPHQPRAGGSRVFCAPSFPPRATSPRFSPPAPPPPPPPPPLPPQDVEGQYAIYQAVPAAGSADAQSCAPITAQEDLPTLVLLGPPAPEVPPPVALGAFPPVGAPTPPEARSTPIAVTPPEATPVGGTPHFAPAATVRASVFCEGTGKSFEMDLLKSVRACPCLPALSAPQPCRPLGL